MAEGRHQPESIPGRAVAEQGVVVLDGPGGVAVSMTPDCAVGTAQSLDAAAGEAREQARAAQD